VFGDLFAPAHLLLILGIALLVFGPSRLPELGRGLGEAIRDFKHGLQEAPAAKPQPPALEAESTTTPTER
jgi:sec-independent protein translocase protein TatA